MKTKYLFVTVAAAIVVGGIVIYKANAAERLGGRLRHAPVLQRVAEKLNLSDSQKSQIKAELKSEKDSLTTLFTQLHDARKNLRDAIRADGATEATVRAASAQVAAVESDLAVERLKLHGKIAPLLTEEQREKLVEIENRIDDFVTDAIGRIGERLAD